MVTFFVTENYRYSLEGMFYMGYQLPFTVYDNIQPTFLSSMSGKPFSSSLDKISSYAMPNVTSCVEVEPQSCV